MSSAPSDAPNASPKLATSTPSSFSLVDESAPGNVAAPPSRRSATTSAIAYPGATRPQTRPSIQATSPIAETPAAPVRHASSTTTPPRSPSCSPASRASSSRGRTPAANTTTSAAMSLPSATDTALTAPPGAAFTLVTWAETLTSTSRPAISRRSAVPPPSSTCSGISRGANSTTVVSAPSARSAPAASSPSRPPPTTRPRTAPSRRCRRSSTYVRSAATSSTVRYTKHPVRSLPFTGGTNGYDPVASTSSSYSIVSSRLVRTVRATGSMPVATTPLRKVTAGSSHSSGSPSARSCGSRPEKYVVSATRSYGSRGSSASTVTRQVFSVSRDRSASTSRCATMPPPTTTRCFALASSLIVILLAVVAASPSPRPSRSSSSPTAPLQPPHPVVARVRRATSPTLVAPPSHAAVIAARVTPLHRHTVRRPVVPCPPGTPSGAAPSPATAGSASSALGSPPTGGHLGPDPRAGLRLCDLGRVRQQVAEDHHLQGGGLDAKDLRRRGVPGFVAGEAAG